MDLIIERLLRIRVRLQSILLHRKIQESKYKRLNEVKKDSDLTGIIQG